MLTLQLLEGSEVCRSMPGPSPLPLPPPSSAAKLPSISQMRRLRLRKGMWLATRHIASKCASWDSTYNCLIQKPKFFLLDSSSFQGFFFFFFNPHSTDEQTEAPENEASGPKAHSGSATESRLGPGSI